MSDSNHPLTPYQVTTAAGQKPLRIDRYLQQVLPQISRHKVHELIEAGLVLVEGKIPKKSYKIGSHETVQVFFEDNRTEDILPEAIPLEIAYEDEHLLVVNKPSGMVAHPAHGNFSGTLVNALMHHLGMKDTGGSVRPGLVHRLDKGTSGLLVIAKNDIIHRKLTDQFSVRSVKREYRAIVWGRFKNNEGIIDAPLGRHPGDRKKFAVVRYGGKNAVTTYRVEESYRDTTYLALKLRTGRTHQIRVHLTSEGHPVFGDADYGGRSKRLGDLPGARKKFYEDLLGQLNHTALHAKTLGFIHPATNEELELSAEPPEDFRNLLFLLSQDAPK